MPRYTILPGFEGKHAQAAWSHDDREFVALVDGIAVCWFGSRSQDAQTYANAANYRDAEQAGIDALAAERDAEAERPRYVQRGGDVVDTAAKRWYCTVTAWPYSPAARDGAELGMAA